MYARFALKRRTDASKVKEETLGDGFAVFDVRDVMPHFHLLQCFHVIVVALLHLVVQPSPR